MEKLGYNQDVKNLQFFQAPKVICFGQKANHLYTSQRGWDDLWSGSSGRSQITFNFWILNFKKKFRHCRPAPWTKLKYEYAPFHKFSPYSQWVWLSSESVSTPQRFSYEIKNLYNGPFCVGVIPERSEYASRVSAVHRIRLPFWAFEINLIEPTIKYLHITTLPWGNSRDNTNRSKNKEIKT